MLEDQAGGTLPAPPGAARASRRRGLAGRAAARLRRRVDRLLRAAAAAARRDRGRLETASLARLQVLALRHPGRLLAPLAAARRLAPGSLFLAQAEALATLRSRGWQAAAPGFARIADPAARPALGGTTAAALLRPAAAQPVALAAPAGDRPGFLPPEAAAATVVYTALVGRPRPLPPVLGIGARLRFLCFTDQPVAAPGWQLLPPPAAAGLDPAAATAFLKIRPAEALAEAAPDATASLWLDPGSSLAGNPDTLLARWLAPHAFALWRHAATDWRDIAERHLIERDVDPGALLGQAAAFAAAGVAPGLGGCDTGMLWRRHGAPGMAALAEAWWRCWRAAPGADDLALYRIQAEAPDLPRPAILPARLGAAGDNAFVLRTGQHPVRPGAASPGSARPRAAGRPAGARLPIVFLADPATAASASTFLRGRQLSAMVAAAFPDRFEVRYTDAADEVRDAVAVLTKGAMQALPARAIAALARANLATIGCWDDVRPEPAKARLVDAHMTLSWRQTFELNRLYPETPAFLVTHHVNSQVPPIAPPGDRLRTGYFGDLQNTVRPASLATMVDLVGIDTRTVNDSWLEALPRYNCHWIVRRPRPWDGWKPFLKGFVAARCGAPVIVTAEDGDAAYYLGDDYPFYARSLAAPDLEMAMAAAAGAFGGADWRRAEEIMAQVAARSSDAQVCAEFAAMVEQLQL